MRSFAGLRLPHIPVRRLWRHTSPVQAAVCRLWNQKPHRRTLLPAIELPDKKFKDVIYLDQATTSFPKPPGVIQGMVNYMTSIGGSPGRSGHICSLRASRIIYDTRKSLALFFGIKDPNRIVFTHSTTESLNLAICGFLREGDHVVITSMEHNSVVRPLRFLEQSRGIEITVVQADSEGFIDPEDFQKALCSHTRLIVVNHSSNVTGAIQPLSRIRDATKGIPLLLDAAQTAGAVPINVENEGIDLLAFPSHKSLLGPPGVGGLYIKEGIEINPLLRGGTGSVSESEEQPDLLPDRYESGTLNGVGIAGLGEAVKFISETGLKKMMEKKRALCAKMLEGLRNIRGVRVFAPWDPEKRVPTVSITANGFNPETLSHKLDQEFEILTRAGLHCSPLSHKTLGTFPAGTLRLSAGFFNTTEEVNSAVEALEGILHSR